MTQRGPLVRSPWSRLSYKQAGAKTNPAVPKPSDAAMQPRCGDMKDRLIPVVPQYNPAYKAGRGQAAT